MTFRNIRPVHILWQKTLGVGMLDGVASGIEQILSLAGVYQETQLEYHGKRRQPNWRNPDGTLAAYQSLDWHIELARTHSKEAGCLNSTVLLNSLRADPTHQTRYELVVVNEPLRSDDSLRKVGGIGRLNQGAVITLDGYLDLLQPVSGESEGDKKKRQLDYFFGTQKLAIHDLGHVLGLFPEAPNKSDPTDEEIKETHCLNKCVMCWEIEVWKNLKHNPFCPSCLEKLQQFFIAP